MKHQFPKDDVKLSVIHSTGIGRIRELHNCSVTAFSSLKVAAGVIKDLMMDRCTRCTLNVIIAVRREIEI